MTEIENQNLAIARTFIEQFLGKGDTSIAAQVLDENVQVTTGLKPDGSINGREEYQQVFSAFYDAFPPIAGSEIVIEDLFAAGDRVVVRFRSIQKHTRDFFGIAATYRDITFIETHVMRLQDGKIIENIVSATNLEFEMLMAPVLTPMILK
jgi:predicted ester cyclase